MKIRSTFLLVSLFLCCTVRAQKVQSNYPKNGYGTQVWGDADVYIGNFKDSLPNGKGKLTAGSTGYTYEGDFIDGKYSGNGVLTYPNGDKYVGQFKNDGRDGTGIFTMKSGWVYKGEFESDLYYGKGSLLANNGKGYDGEWRQGKKYGIGTYNFDDGSSYTGSWKNDKKEGQGKYTKANGNYAEGLFKNDKVFKVKYYNNKNIVISMQEYNK
jgi:hypothetical protein